MKDWIENRSPKAFTFWKPDEPAMEVDLVLVTPIPFDDLEAGAEEKSAWGVRFAVASIDHLITLKEAANRLVDRVDIEMLRLIRKSR